MGSPRAKKGAEPEPEVLLDQDGNPIDMEALARAGGEVSAAVVDELLDAVAVECRKRRMKALIAPLASMSVVNASLKVANWFTITPDTGSSSEINVDSKDTSENMWVLETEPVSSSQDAWARGAVKVKRPKPIESFSDLEHMKSHGSTSPSNMSLKSSKFGGSRGGSRGGKRPLAPTPDIVPVFSIDLDADENMTDGSLKGVSSDAGTLLSGAGQTPAQLLAEMDAQNKAARLAAKQAAEKAAAAAAVEEEHKALMKSLSAKNFMYDDDGSIIMIEPIEAHKLPSTLGLSVDNNVQDVYEPVATPNRSKVGSRGGSRSGSKPASSKGERKKQKPAPNYFTVSGVAQPALIQTMTVNPGVVLKVGQRSKGGQALTGSEAHMSRKDYESKKMQEEASYYASQQGSLYDNSLNLDFDDQTVSSNEDMTVDEGMASVGNYSANMSIGMGSSIGGSPRPEFESRFSDVDSLSGARRAVKKTTPQTSLGEDMHEKLINAPDWGNPSGNGEVKSPARMGSKPGPKQTEIIKQMSGGPNAKARRDRYQPCSMVPNKDRAHLPAPPLGESMGHGMAKTIPASIPRNAMLGDDDQTLNSQGTKSRTENGSIGMFPPIDGRGATQAAAPMGGRSRNESILGSKGGGVIKMQ
jgi:hypothetical protein